MTRKLILVATVGALAAAVWLAFGRSQKAITARSGRPGDVAEASSSGALASLAGGLSTDRIAALERRVRELEAMSGTEPAEQPSPEPAPPALDETIAEPQPDPAEVAARTEERMAYLETALSHEPADPAWSGPTETALGHAFELGAFRGSALQRTRCGSTFCAVVVRHDDDHARVAFEAFAHEAGMGGDFAVREVDGRPETIAFFVRSEHDMPDHPVRRSK